MTDDTAIVSKTPTGYLAVTPEGHRFHIGVMGDSEDEAVGKLAERVAIATELVDRLEAEGDSDDAA